MEFKKISSCFIVLLLISSAIFSANNKKAPVDVNGFWNENDIQIVCTDIISQVENSPRIAKFEKDNGRKAIVVVGKIKNESSERIDTRLVAKTLQNSIMNSGILEFVADREERKELNEENPSEEVVAADFMLNGTVKSMVTNLAREQQRTYYVTIQMVDIESSRVVFSGEKQISKNFKAPKGRY